MKTFPMFLLAFVFHLAAFAQDGQQQLASLGDFSWKAARPSATAASATAPFGSSTLTNPTPYCSNLVHRNHGALVRLVGPGKIVDSSTYYVILVDALGDGFYFSVQQPGTATHESFPKFGIRDMVVSQHQLLTQVLHIDHLKAVMGISWAVCRLFSGSFPTRIFADKAIPIGRFSPAGPVRPDGYGRRRMMRSWATPPGRMAINTEQPRADLADRL